MENIFQYGILKSCKVSIIFAFFMVCEKLPKFLIALDENYGRRGIEPNTGLNPFLKIVLNVFCMHETNYLTYILSFFI